MDLRRYARLILAETNTSQQFAMMKDKSKPSTYIAGCFGLNCHMIKIMKNSMKVNVKLISYKLILININKIN